MKQSDILAILLNEENTKRLDQLGKIHNYTKHYLLLAEELSEDGVAFLQPMKEHRDAYDHLVRVLSLHTRVDDLPNDFDYNYYINDNLQKSYGHEYRAFFDTADWLTFICRKAIRETLSFAAKRKMYISKYGEKDFEEIRRFINNVPFEIAKYREKKDVSKSALLEEVEEYRVALDRLIKIYKKIHTI